MVTVFLSILNQMEIHLVQNRKENCHHDHIPFNLKGNWILVFSVWQGCDIMQNEEYSIFFTSCSELKNLRQHMEIGGVNILEPLCERLLVLFSINNVYTQVFMIRKCYEKIYVFFTINMFWEYSIILKTYILGFFL